jgi:magnesium transporter
MRGFNLQGKLVNELVEPNAQQLLDSLQIPKQGFVWLSCSRKEFEQHQVAVQVCLQRLVGIELVDLHVSDLLNANLSSGYDFTSLYDLLIFRRLSVPVHAPAAADPTARTGRGARHHKTPILRHIDTSPIGFVVLDRLLFSVHPDDCLLRDAYAQRLMSAGVDTTAPGGDVRSAGARGVPANPPDLMLRIISHAVDGFLQLRRELSHQLDAWQNQLLNPHSRGANWHALLDARRTLHQLDETCEDQRAAIQAWLEALKAWPVNDPLLDTHQRDLLHVRSRDVLEHIERVVHHVGQLEHNAETAVEIHFNAQSHRTNEVMRTLTVFTAVFLPLNLIAGIFGMNFEFIPLIHMADGFWWAMGAMAVIAIGLTAYFLRNRYLGRD